MVSFALLLLICYFRFGSSDETLVSFTLAKLTLLDRILFLFSFIFLSATCSSNMELFSFYSSIKKSNSYWSFLNRFWFRSSSFENNSLAAFISFISTLMLSAIFLISWFWASTVDVSRSDIALSRMANWLFIAVTLFFKSLILITSD